MRPSHIGLPLSIRIWWSIILFLFAVMADTLDEMARQAGVVHIDIDKIQNLEEVKAMLKILVMAHGVGSPELRIHVDVMNKMPILNNLVRD